VAVDQDSWKGVAGVTLYTNFLLAILYDIYCLML
jgi:hypothetical protein